MAFNNNLEYAKLYQQNLDKIAVQEPCIVTGKRFTSYL